MDKLLRETVRVERVTYKVPILSCGHKHHPIVANKPVRKHYPCAACKKSEQQQIARIGRSDVFEEKS